MSEDVRFPLSWPPAWKRTPAAERRRAAFKSFKRAISPAEASRRLEQEVDRLGADRAVLSTNLRLRLDGGVRSDQPEPTDRGAAVYFTLRRTKQRVCFACDKWDRVADNIAALAAHIEALRRIDRYGVGTTGQAFAGYVALPAKPDWWDVLGLPRTATVDEVNAAFRQHVRTVHPDVGGDRHRFEQVVAARDEAYKALGVTA